MAIYSVFSHRKWWSSIAMLNYQRVCEFFQRFHHSKHVFTTTLDQGFQPKVESPPQHMDFTRDSTFSACHSTASHNISQYITIYHNISQAKSTSPVNALIIFRRDGVRSLRWPIPSSGLGQVPVAHHNGRRAPQFSWNLPGPVEGGAFR